MYEVWLPFQLRKEKMFCWKQWSWQDHVPGERNIWECMELEGPDPEAWEIGGVRVVPQYPRPDDYEPGGAGRRTVCVSCEQCDFLSKSSLGLQVHVRAKHKDIKLTLTRNNCSNKVILGILSNVTDVNLWLRLSKCCRHMWNGNMETKMRKWCCEYCQMWIYG